MLRSVIAVFLTCCVIAPVGAVSSESVFASSSEERPVIILDQNYPNPVRDTTTIDFYIDSTLGDSVYVEIEIYNIFGSCIETIVNARVATGQCNRVTWKVYDNPTGVYFYNLRIDEFEEPIRLTRKMVVLN